MRLLLYDVLACLFVCVCPYDLPTFLFACRRTYASVHMAYPSAYFYVDLLHVDVLMRLSI